jgi:hypothetical protein
LAGYLAIGSDVAQGFLDFSRFGISNDRRHFLTETFAALVGKRIAKQQDADGQRFGFESTRPPLS